MNNFAQIPTRMDYVPENVLLVLFHFATQTEYKYVIDYKLLVQIPFNARKYMTIFNT